LNGGFFAPHDGQATAGFVVGWGGTSGERGVLPSGDGESVREVAGGAGLFGGGVGLLDGGGSLNSNGSNSSSN
jgi:hypothetical protein